ncbi:MAG: hypothetical protein AAF637_00010 [Pseudomonadota bacterium]
MTREPSGIAAALVDLVDVLLPGDDLFPKASTIGLQALVAERVLAQRGESGLDQLLDAIDACGGPLAELDQDGRAGVILRFEQEHEDLFTQLRTAAFLGYYQHPAVHTAIRALGHPYHAVLLPKGYAVKPFDPAIDAPSHGPGWYKKTEEVARVDLSGLEFLAQETRDA